MPESYALASSERGHGVGCRGLDSTGSSQYGPSVSDCNAMAWKCARTLHQVSQQLFGDARLIC